MQHLIVHHTICSKWVILRSCPTQKSRPITFCPYMTVIPSRRKREVGLGVMLPERSHWHSLRCPVIKLRLGNAWACSTSNLISSRQGHDLHKLDFHLD